MGKRSAWLGGPLQASEVVLEGTRGSKVAALVEDVCIPLGGTVARQVGKQGAAGAGMVSSWIYKCELQVVVAVQAESWA